jgi:phage baseplate assembly protein W
MTIARNTPYSDLDFSFKTNPNTKDVGIKKNTNAIKQSVLNILKTNHGERPFNYYFGANLRSFLFENISSITAANISSAIKNALRNWEPRVEVLNINIKTIPDDNDVYITLTVKIVSTNEITDISTTLERLR